MDLDEKEPPPAAEEGSVRAGGHRARLGKSRDRLAVLRGQLAELERRAVDCRIAGVALGLELAGQLERVRTELRIAERIERGGK